MRKQIHRFWIWLRRFFMEEHKSLLYHPNGQRLSDSKRVGRARVRNKAALSLIATLCLPLLVLAGSEEGFITFGFMALGRSPLKAIEIFGRVEEVRGWILFALWLGGSIGIAAMIEKRFGSLSRSVLLTLVVCLFIVSFAKANFELVHEAQQRAMNASVPVSDFVPLGDSIRSHISDSLHSRLGDHGKAVRVFIVANWDDNSCAVAKTVESILIDAGMSNVDHICAKRIGSVPVSKYETTVAMSSNRVNAKITLLLMHSLDEYVRSSVTLLPEDDEDHIGINISGTPLFLPDGTVVF